MHTVDLSAMKPRELLQKLKATHLELQISLHDMEALTTSPAVSRSLYSSARFRISNASLKRRAIFRAVCDKLSEVSAAEDANVIARLRQSDAALVKHSAKHVREWPANRIEADWKGYCKASGSIRRAMTQELRAVEQNLFPLLTDQSVVCRSFMPRAA